MKLNADLALATIAVGIPVGIGVAYARPHEEVYSLRHFSEQRAAKIVGRSATKSTMTLEQCDLLSGEDPNSNNKFAIAHERKHCEDRIIKISSGVLQKYVHAPTAVAADLIEQSQ
jgi:hypothetical protein